jgi:hypothetical protein
VRREEATAILSAVPDGLRPRRVLDRWADDMVMCWPCGIRSRGVNSVFEAMQRDYDSGVGYRLTGNPTAALISVPERRRCESVKVHIAAHLRTRYYSNRTPSV